jgi:hypothetical protein
VAVLLGTSPIGSGGKEVIEASELTVGPSTVVLPSTTISANGIIAATAPVSASLLVPLQQRIREAMSTNIDGHLRGAMTEVDQLTHSSSSCVSTTRRAVVTAPLHQDATVVGSEVSRLLAVIQRLSQDNAELVDVGLLIISSLQLDLPFVGAFMFADIFYLDCFVGLSGAGITVAY